MNQDVFAVGANKPVPPEKVLIVNTGGTICMVHSEPGNPLSPLVPAGSWSDLVKNHPILGPGVIGVEVDYRQLSELIDSSDIEEKHWREIASIIGTSYHAYSGFVVIHGTDTMCYTASALSFMLENLAKPVILTGSQRPLVEPRSDAVQNLVTSLQLAAPTAFDYPVIPEVCIFFHDQLLRGNRSRKLSTSGYAGFESPNYPPLAVAGEHVVVNKKAIRGASSSDFFVNTSMDSRVMVLEIFPGFKPTVLESMIDDHGIGRHQISGLILKTYGTGNAPGSEAFLSAVEKVCRSGVVVVDITQCPQGMVELGLYEASCGLMNSGVVSGVDMTPEAAVCKLMYLLGKGWTIDEVKRVMQIDLNGEQSMNIHTMDFGGPGKADPVYCGTALVPGDADLGESFRNATIRLEGVEGIGWSLSETGVELELFVNDPGADGGTAKDDPRRAGMVRVGPKPGGMVEVFCDVTAASKRLLRPGRMASVSVVSPAGDEVQWTGMKLALHTEVE